MTYPAVAVAGSRKRPVQGNEAIQFTEFPQIEDPERAVEYIFQMRALREEGSSRFDLQRRKLVQAIFCTYDLTTARIGHLINQAQPNMRRILLTAFQKNPLTVDQRRCRCKEWGEVQY